MALICMSLMNRDVEYFLLYLLPLYTSEKYLFRSFAYIKNHIFSFLTAELFEFLIYFG